MNASLSTRSAPADPSHASDRPVSRLLSIDALRGLVILLMLVDHTREFFYFNHQVGDPMDLATTSPSLFFTRLTAHLCAPVFVLLTGLAAWLYGNARGGTPAVSAFLFKRGLFLVVLELTLVNFAWNFDLTPPTIFLQVIWVIGLSMIALAALVHLPRPALIAIGLAIVFGHNLLDGIVIPAGQPGHVLWAILHDRGYLDLPWGGQARTSYPLLPWIGVIALGYAIGPWFDRTTAPTRRRRLLLVAGGSALAAFAVLRFVGGDGEPSAWLRDADGLTAVMSFFNLTKYPPSALFLLLTLGLGALILVLLDGRDNRGIAALAVFGAAPLFFYLFHLYLLHALNRIVGMALGDASTLVSVPNVAAIWLLAAIVAVPCWFACRAFVRVKRRHDAWWLRYL